jgi:nicotinamide-nucleotide amidase
LTRPRALLVVTGSELVRGERTDLNGPFLAREVLSRGVEPSRITLVGDGEEELEAALREGLGADLLITSGGLGPTHDDRTVELLARVLGRPDARGRGPSRADRGRVAAVAERLRRPYADFEPGVRKQASMPEGAASVGLAGTAPGLVMEENGTAVVVLPGPPGELKRLWASALEAEPVRRVLERARPPGRRVLRFFGASESAIARALEEAGGERPGVEATICARDFEIHVDLVVDPGAKGGGRARGRARRPLERWLFARDERPIEEHVLALCRARGLTLATAESCTGGLVAERLTRVPGSSDVFLGGIVAYANEVKAASWACRRTDRAARRGVGRGRGRAWRPGRASGSGGRGDRGHGVAGPGGGTREKPVGLVYVAAETPDAARVLDFNYPADRQAVRSRAAVAGLHLVRRLLARS